MKIRDSVKTESELEVFWEGCSDMARVMVYSGCVVVRLNGES